MEGRGSADHMQRNEREVARTSLGSDA
eukprot:COSAG06_NODE_53328_length_300_cov_1.597015_1_plen_26_part_01